MVSRVSHAHTHTTKCRPFCSKYCDLLQKCNDAVATGYKHSTDTKVREFLSESQKLCPPPVGSWTISFSKKYDVEELPKGIFGPLQSVR